MAAERAAARAAVGDFGASAVVRDAVHAAAGDRAAVGDGVRSAVLLGREHGAVHLSAQMTELDDGASVAPHRHAHEESVWVLSGTVELWLDGAWYRLGRDCYAHIPLGRPHAWRCRHPDGARWFTVRSPLPPVPSEPDMVQTAATGVDLDGPVHAADTALPGGPAVGRLAPEDYPPFGPLSLGGIGHYGSHVRRISLAMAVDGQRGAVHHTMFGTVVPPGDPGRPARLVPHTHPFEEGYLIVEGRTIWSLAGEEVTASAGDLVWTGVGAAHAVTSATTEPARWIEVQSPAPPRQHGFLFPHEWRHDGAGPTGPAPAPPL